MKRKIILIFVAIFATNYAVTGQESNASEKFGNSLNLGIGLAYYGYVNNSVPAINVNYEFDVLRNFTLAPSISYYSYSNSYYWGDKNKNYPYRYYDYSETVIPIGIKGSYYFDELLVANDNWDFYASGSLGFALVSSTWENSYYGDKNAYRGAQPMFFNIHIGSEYHFNNHLGIYLDLSTGISTIGLAIH